VAKAKQTKRPLIRALTVFLILTVAVMTCYHAVIHIGKTLYPIQYSDLVEQAAEENGYPPSLIYAIIHTESKFDKDAVSSADAKGLMQITDATFHWAQRRAGEKKSDSNNLFIPEINIKYGCYILTLLSEQFSNIETVLAAYNAGQGHVAEWLKDSRYSADGVTLHTIPYEETANYISRVLTAQKRYQLLYNIP